MSTPRISNRSRRTPWKVAALVPDAVCTYCGATGCRMTFDHVRPRSKGGTNRRRNCVISCRRCNTFKADRTPAELVAILQRMLDVLLPFAQDETN